MKDNIDSSNIDQDFDDEINLEEAKKDLQKNSVQSQFKDYFFDSNE